MTHVVTLELPLGRPPGCGGITQECSKVGSWPQSKLGEGITDEAKEEIRVDGVRDTQGASEFEEVQVYILFCA